MHLELGEPSATRRSMDARRRQGDMARFRGVMRTKRYADHHEEYEAGAVLDAL